MNADFELNDFYKSVLSLSETEIREKAICMPFFLNIEAMLIILSEVKRLRSTDYQNFALFTLADELEKSLKNRNQFVSITLEKVKDNMTKLI